MKHFMSLALVLAIFWLVNSGHFEPLVLGLGVVSVIGVVLLSQRLERIDGERFSPVILSPRLPGYLAWLLKDIIVSNVEVVYYIWKRKLDIRPMVFRVDAKFKNDAVQVFYANSITMTPGTLTLEVHDDEFLVHALEDRAARDCLGGEMDRRIRRLED